MDDKLYKLLLDLDTLAHRCLREARSDDEWQIVASLKQLQNQVGRAVTRHHRLTHDREGAQLELLARRAGRRHDAV